MSDVSFELIFTLVCAVLAIVLFLLEWVPAGQTAMVVLAALLLGGVLTPAEAFSGFSNSATVTVTAMFVVSAAMQRTGAVAHLRPLVGRVLSWPRPVGLLLLAIAVAFASAFVNNTTVVAILMPAMVAAATRAGISPSKLLMPLSFASMLGGACTLIGTSTNLVVSSVAEDYGLAPLGMFELAPAGLVLFAAGAVYLALLSSRLIPPRRELSDDLTEGYETASYIAEVLVPAESTAVGQTLREAGFLEDTEGQVLEILRGRTRYPVPRNEWVLQGGDVLRVRCPRGLMPALLARPDVVVGSTRLSQETLTTSDLELVEVSLPPGSDLIGRRVSRLRLRTRRGAILLALRHSGTLRHERLLDVRLRVGDVLLLAVDRDRADEIDRDGNLVVLSREPAELYRHRHLPIALLVIALVVTAAASGLLSIATAAVVGALILVLSGCVHQDEAIDAVDWNVVFLLGGILPLGMALHTSGGDVLAAHALERVAGAVGPTGVISVLFLAATLLTAFISNNGTAALLAPIAIATATTLGVDPRPFLVAVAFGASMSFVTPIGYQTNTMIYGAGAYRFSDFARLGGLLTLILWGLASVVIPIFF